MRNLALCGEKRCRLSNLSLSLSSSKEIHNIASVCHLVGDDDRAVLTRQGTLTRMDRHGTSVVWTCNLNEIVLSAASTITEGGEEVEAPPPPPSVVSVPDGWSHLFLVQDERLIALNQVTGAMVSVSVRNDDSSAIDSELVGEFEEGIAAAAWSQHEEVLWIVTYAAAPEDNLDENNTKRRAILLTLNTEWHVLSETDLEGDILMNEPVHLACSPSHASRCAISVVDADDATRKIRIYHTPDGTVYAGRTEDGSGKLAPNLQTSDLAWAGPGCSKLLATVRRKGKKTQLVAFLEPNGLRHGQFALRCSPTTRVIALEWNTDASLLAVALREENGDADKVQLWHRSNYHWYLKRELILSGPMECMNFHPEQAYNLWVAYSGMEWTEYEFGWQTSTVSSASTAYVIDGCSLNMTALGQALIPPPMSAALVEFPSPVSEVAWHGQDHAIVFLANASMGLLRSKPGKRWSAPTLVGIAVVNKGNDVDPRSLRNILVVEEKEQRILLIAAGCDTNRNEDCLVTLSLEWNDDQAQVTIENKLAVPGSILCMTTWADAASEGALVQLQDGQLLEFEYNKSDVAMPFALNPSPAEPLLEPCPWMAALKHPVEPIHHSSHDCPSRIVVGMSKRGRLYCHDVLLADSVSSFALSTEQEYLVYVTAASQCFLRFVHFTQLSAAMDPFLGSDENQLLLQGYEPRNVERGARLVTIFPNKPVAVLQMPRGNLEAIYPRALVLRFAMQQILEERCDFKPAYEMMRRQKVDLNLLVDMDPEKFLQDGVETFVDQVRNIDHLNLFISSLQNWNSTAERYLVPQWIRKTTVSQGFDFTTKVNQVCQRMRSVMINAEQTGSTCSGKKVEEGYYLLPTLSTFAKEDPPRLEDALLLIKENAQRQSQRNKSSKPIMFSDTAQHSIQYLAFLAEYELLFNCALGLYDYDLARAVARNSQMDPKVYLPLLKRYRELPYHYSRYEVDMRLKRYEHALRNLAESRASREVLEGIEPFVDRDLEIPVGNTLDDCMKLIQEHEQHRLGLELFQDPPSIRRILISLGNLLLEQDKAQTALTVFLGVSPVDEERAMHAAKTCMDWKTYFNLASMSKDWNIDRQHMLAHELSNVLSSRAESSFGDQRELLANAARILQDYGNDAAGAIEMLLRAKMWAEGQRIARLHSLDTHKCLDAAETFARSSIMDLEERRQSFQTTMERYKVVLQTRKEAIAAGEEENIMNIQGDEEDNGSLFSTASTTASNASVRSTGSVGSLSSVISVKSTTSFTVSGADQHYRHRSKFNNLGEGKKRKKKKKKKGPGQYKTVPGSQAEFLELVQALKFGVVDADTMTTISETIEFLSRNKQLALARTLFDSYVALSNEVSTSRADRMESARVARLEHEARARREGTDGLPPVVLEGEKEVDRLVCADLPETVTELFSLLPEATFPSS